MRMMVRNGSEDDGDFILVLVMQCCAGQDGVRG